MPGKVGIIRWVKPGHLAHDGVPFLSTSLFPLATLPHPVWWEHLCKTWNWSFSPIGLTVEASALHVLNEEQHFTGFSLNSQEFGDF